MPHVFSFALQSYHLQFVGQPQRWGHIVTYPRGHTNLEIERICEMTTTITCTGSGECR
jgi:hypothetical protein